jgi:hypothetical protein
MPKNNTTEILKKNWLGGILAIILAYFVYVQKPHILVIGFFSVFSVKTLFMLFILYIIGAYIQSNVQK